MIVPHALRWTVFLASISLVLPLLAPRNVTAQAGASLETEATFDEVLEETARMLATLKSYRVDVEGTWESEGQEPAACGSSKHTLIVQQPRKFRIEATASEKAEPDLVCVSDGQKSTTLLAARKIFSQSPVISAQNKVATNTMLAMSLAGSGIDVLLQPDLVNFMHSRATGIKHVGDTKIEDTRCHHFEMMFGEHHVQLWVSAEEHPLLLQIVRRTTVPLGEGKSYSLVATSKLKWTLDKTYPEETFAIAIPEGSRKVGDIYEALTGDEAATRVGQQLPDFELTKLDGTKISLNKQENRKPTVLIFWATWCVPSVSDQSSTSDFVKRSIEQGVDFYAVNVGESLADVRKFVASAKPASTMVLDSQGAAATALRLDALPAAVIVDASGKVTKIIHGEPEQLRKDLAAAVLPFLTTASAPESPTTPAPKQE